MRFVDMNTDITYTIPDLHSAWKSFREEDPGNHARDFKYEFFQILIDTINGRNDFHIIGPTSPEISRLIGRLWPQSEIFS